MYGTLCLIVAQTLVTAPQFLNPVEHPQMRSIVVERVAANTNFRRSRHALRTPSAGELEPQVEENAAFDSIIAEPDIEPIVTPPPARKQTSDSVEPTATGPSEVPTRARLKQPALFEIRDPARVSWLDRFSLEEVRIESSHTDFNVNGGQPAAWPSNVAPPAPNQNASSTLKPVPFDRQPVVRPPLVPNTPYRPYRFPDSPEQYRASVSAKGGGSTCTNCGCTLQNPTVRCTNTNCGCRR